MDDLGFWLKVFLCLLALGYLAVGIVFALIEAFLLRSMITMIRMGPRAADEAAASGALKNRRWWKF